MAWEDINRKQNNNSTTTVSDLVVLDGQKRLRLLLPESGPNSYWSYSISAPDGSYKTWIAPPQDQDFFSKNRQIFGIRPVHAGLAWDYDEGAIKILESGNQIWEQIKALYDVGKNLSERDIVITKSGTGRGTSYKVVDMDPTPFNIDINSYEKPDMESRYQPPTYETVIEDLRQMGFTNPEEIFSTKPLDLEYAKSLEVPFGKHKGKTLNDVYMVDSQYILFLATKIDRDDVKQCARMVANSLMGTQYEVGGIPPSIDDVSFTAPTQNEGGQQAPTPPAPPTPEEVVDNQGNRYELRNNEWVMVEPAVPTPPVPPVPEAPTAPVQPEISNRDSLVESINKKFEEDPQYKDFMKIIDVMKKATAPNEKTSIKDFTDEEVQKLAELVL